MVIHERTVASLYISCETMLIKNKEGYTGFYLPMVVSFTHPLAPPLKQVCILRSILILFERGKELERGRRPLSSKLPFPAINACSFVLVVLAGGGQG